MTVSAQVVAVRSGVSVPGIDASLVTFRPMPTWLTVLTVGRAAAITLRRSVFVRPDMWDAVVEGARPELVAHELIHVRQWTEGGTLRFLRTYLADYVRLLILGCGHDQAYRNIGYEWSAYSEARNMVRRP